MISEPREEPSKSINDEMYLLVRVLIRQMKGQNKFGYNNSGTSCWCATCQARRSDLARNILLYY
jgi:hypothetical protein